MIVKGRPHLHSSGRRAGKVGRKYLGPATPERVELIKACSKRQPGKPRRNAWPCTWEEMKAAMEAAGYHDPKGHGRRLRWRDRPDQ